MSASHGWSHCFHLSGGSYVDCPLQVVPRINYCKSQMGYKDAALVREHLEKDWLWNMFHSGATAEYDEIMVVIVGWCPRRYISCCRYFRRGWGYLTPSRKASIPIERLVGRLPFSSVTRLVSRVGMAHLPDFQTSGSNTLLLVQSHRCVASCCRERTTSYRGCRDT